MSAKQIVFNVVSLAVNLMLVITISGCTRSTARTIAPTKIASTQLSNFIVGSWLSTDVKSNEFPSSTDNQYQIVFEEDDRVKYIVIYPDGNKEGYTFKYYFIGQDSIHVENLRISGGEIWVLERSGESLIITRKIDGGSTRIVLQRNN